MSFDTNWNIEKYRADYESDEHWNLKAKFISAHKSRFPEEQLICYAQVFFNMEFMGCRYPAETMTLIGELSKDVAREFRESRQNRLKRTFVTASDAIEAKYNTNKDNLNVTSFNRKQRIEFAKATCLSSTSDKRPYYGDTNSRGLPKRARIEPNNDPIRMFFNENQDLILYQGDENETPLNTIQVTMSKNKVVVKFETPHPGCTWMLFNGKRMLFGESKADVGAKMLVELQKYFYTIKRKTKFLSRTKTIEKDDQRLSKTTAPPVSSDVKIDSSNLGFKLLKSLGWSGGGLGKTKEGIQEPIQASIKVDRSGLGNMTNGKITRQILKNVLIEYKTSNDLCDLVFSTDFTKEERAVIHSIALECKLKSTSFGKKEDRQLVISKPSTVQELFVLLQNSPDSLIHEKYEIVLPTEFNC